MKKFIIAAYFATLAVLAGAGYLVSDALDIKREDMEIRKAQVTIEGLERAARYQLDVLKFKAEMLHRAGPQVEVPTQPPMILPVPTPEPKDVLKIILRPQVPRKTYLPDSDEEPEKPNAF